jgi:hypothetical protein
MTHLHQPAVSRNVNPAALALTHDDNGSRAFAELCGGTYDVLTG